MQILYSLCVLLATALATPIGMEPLSDVEIFYINNLSGANWKAGRNFQPHELEKVKRLLGVNIEESKAYNRLHMKYKKIVVRDDLPTQFDPRQKWPNCSSLSEIRDQADCGSCWAFGAAEAMTDRICIKGGGNVHISAQDINSCCRTCGHGCRGGFPAAAWRYYVHDGVVTGGQYNSSQGCMPYTLKKCDHHVPGKYGPCSGTERTPRCHKRCRDGYGKDYHADKHYGKEHYLVESVKEMMQELVDHGPVTAAFDVYSDFLTYKSGVYRHKSGSLLGGHAIKILGYGTENGEDYWLVANSWNEDWGDKGYFKIAKGDSECGIEDQVVTGKPQL